VARTLAALAVLALVAASVLTQAAGASVDSGTIVANRGVAAVTLDMTRAQVIRTLGKPLRESRSTAIMSYSRRGLFDVFLDPRSKRVRLIAIAGRGYCLRGGPCLLRTGGAARLMKRFGAALDPVSVEGSERALRLGGRFRGDRVFTQFSLDRRTPNARITQVTIGYVA
jgi:hypothetical protein